MRKTIVAGLTALALFAPTLSYAQQPSDTQKSTEHEHWRPSPADLKAFTDARIAALKAGLQLTPDQDKNWPPVEQAIREMAQARQQRMAAWHDKAKGEDAIARLRAAADAMSQRATEIKKLADASEPLYQSLNEDQKHRLRFLVRMVMGHGHGGWHHHGHSWNG